MLLGPLAVCPNIVVKIRPTSAKPMVIVVTQPTERTPAAEVSPLADERPLLGGLAVEMFGRGGGVCLRPTHEASAVTFPKAGNLKAPLRLVYAISEARARAVQGVVPAAVGLSSVVDAAPADHSSAVLQLRDRGETAHHSHATVTGRLELGHMRAGPPPFSDTEFVAAFPEIQIVLPELGWGSFKVAYRVTTRGGQL
jgi:hypothetical protein